MNTLIALGGGLDSTFLLYELLKDTDDIVHGLFCDLSTVQYDDKRAARDVWKASAIAETIAVRRICEWFAAHVRPFVCQTIFVESSAEARAPTVMREAAKMAAGFDRFIFGRAADQMCTPRNPPYYRKLWAESAPAGIPMEWPLVDRNQGRPHALVALPPELTALTISCNEPDIAGGLPVPCGSCPKCYQTAKAKEMLAGGMTPDQAQDWIMRAVGAGQYHGQGGTDQRYQSALHTDDAPFMRSPE